MSTYEKLGVFYLGRSVDPATGETSAEPLLYDSKDLTTHAVCVGMTGSGKTGLCVSLLEEAAIDKVPAIILDPKGDLANLMLTFPELKPADFRPWIDESAATRKGMTPDEYAKDRAQLWKKGLAGWDQDGERIARLKEAVDVAIYTPGGGAGLPLRVLRSFTAPPAAIIADAEAFRERIQSAVSGLLVLLDIDADPVRSREHILISNILDRVWREGQDLDLAGLIRKVQDPPFSQVGVFDVDSFFPSKDRFGLAMQINNVLASPGFAAWMEGEPLDIDRLLWTPAGKPRISILSIAHLSDTERMFFVTLLLNEVVTWMRSQPGTGSLRALLYMDEVFGYLPPTANPPSKIPMLTLLKQARAFGLGVVLATQNPVDLDYKALSNAGTWFLGRLQTERDKARVLDGLEGASAASGQVFDRSKIEALLSGLQSRMFLLNNVHEEAPVLFSTRWAMSYLAGPMTRRQISVLMADRKAEAAASAAAGPAVSAKMAAATGAAAPASTPAATADDRPVLPPGIPEVFLQSRGGAGELLYRPALLGRARLHYVQATANVDAWEEVTLVSLVLDEVEAEPWEGADALPAMAISEQPEGPADFAELPADLVAPKNYAAWGKSLAAYLYRERPMMLLRCKAPKAMSNAGEAEGDFRSRLALMVREGRDLAAEKLRAKYEKRFATLKARILRDEQRVERETQQHGQQKLSTALSVGTAVLGAMFGRKKLSATSITKASTAMRSAGRIGKEKGDVERAAETLAANRAKLAEMETEMEAAVDALDEAVDAETLALDEVTVRPRKADIAAQPVALAWTPWRKAKDGTVVPDYGV